MDADTLELFRGQQTLNRDMFATLKGLTAMLDCQQRQIVSVVNFIQRLADHITGDELAALPELPTPEAMAKAAEEVERLKQIWDLEPGEAKAEG